MNAARLERSDRLKRLLAVLRDRKPRTTRQLIREAHVCAVNSCIAELRQQGKRIKCWRSGNLWFYQMEGRK